MHRPPDQKEKLDSRANGNRADEPATRKDDDSPKSMAERVETVKREGLSQHWRRKTDDDASAFVREHLRGTSAFTWNGMRCEIKVSPADLLRNGEVQR